MQRERRGTRQSNSADHWCFHFAVVAVSLHDLTPVLLTRVWTGRELALQSRGGMTKILRDTLHASC